MCRAITLVALAVALATVGACADATPEGGSVSGIDVADTGADGAAVGGDAGGDTVGPPDGTGGDNAVDSGADGGGSGDAAGDTRDAAGSDAMDGGPGDAAAADATEDAGPDDTGDAVACAAPLEPCSDTVECCAEGSTCVTPSCAGVAPGVGRCSVPGRGGCGCGAVWDDCEAPGTSCLEAGCENPGLCVTPAERAAICASGDTGCFQCPACDAPCDGPPPPECNGSDEVRTYTQQWLGCEQGACVYAFEVTACPVGEVCSGGVCQSGCGPAPADLVGTWTWTDAVAVVPGKGELPAYQVGCAATTLDQNLSKLVIGADGSFSGPLYTDYSDTWSGCLAAGGDAWTLLLASCEIECYGHDTEPGKLGTATLDGNTLVVTRTGAAIVDKDGLDCEACSMCAGPDLDILSGLELRFVYTK